MNKAKFKQFLLTSIIAVFLIGCGSSNTGSDSSEDTGEGSPHDEVLQVAYAIQPPSIDPLMTQAQSGADIASNFFETLITTDSDKNIQPMLADSWEISEDGKVITFHLREGVLFHNGKEMLADDVVASMNRWLKETRRGQDYFPDASFEKVDDYTVSFDMLQPVSTSLNILAYGADNFAAIMPQEIVDNAGEKGITEFIGTGPYQFVEWKQDQYIHLERFDDYQSRDEPSDGPAGKREALFKDIYINIVTDPSTRVSGIQSGEYDIALGIPSENALQLKDDPNINTVVYPAGNFEFYFNKRKGIFSNKIARQAIAIGLDLESILEGSFTDEEFYKLNHNIMLDSQKEQWSSDHGKEIYNQNNIEKAKEMLNEAGYNGEEVKILTRRELNYVYQSSVILQQQLKDMGMDAKLEVVDRATNDKLREDEDGFDIFIVPNVPLPEPTASVFLTKEFGGWTDSPELDEMITEFRSFPSLEDAINYFDNIQEWFYDYTPIIKVGDYMNIDITNKDISGYEFYDAMNLWNVSKTK